MSIADSHLVKLSMAYMSKPNPKLGDVKFLRSRRVIMTYHSHWKNGVVKIKIWIRDPGFSCYWDLKATYLGRNGKKRWNTFWIPSLESRMESLISNYDTDALAEEIRTAFEFVAQQKLERRKEIEEIIRLELE